MIPLDQIEGKSVVVLEWGRKDLMQMSNESQAIFVLEFVVFVNWIRNDNVYGSSLFLAEFH